MLLYSVNYENVFGSGAPLGAPYSFTWHDATSNGKSIYTEPRNSASAI